MKKILIVDDSSTMRTSLEFTLINNGHEVLQATDGQKGLEVLNTYKENDIGMIITDINMPNMDGITMIKEIKKTLFKYTPILVMTTEAEESKKAEAGASGGLVKPFKPDQLIGVVSRFIK